MTVYVDELRSYDEASIKPAARQFGKRWCHMTADTEQELHDFAARLGLKRAWYQIGGRRVWHWYLSHYDLVPSKRALAVKLGAEEGSLRAMAERFAAELAPAPVEGGRGDTRGGARTARGAVVLHADQRRVLGPAARPVRHGAAGARLLQAPPLGDLRGLGR